MTEPAPFSPVETTRRLVRQARTAALATIARRGGHPFGSMVSVACEPDGTPILLMSTLAAHSRNLAADSRASLLYEDRTVADPQQGGRVTVVGRVERIAEPEAAARRYLARLPEATLYAGFADFAFFRLVVEEAHLVAGFGRAMGVRREDMLLDSEGGEAVIAAEAAIVAALNDDGGRASRLAAGLGAPAGDWRVIGIDPEGVDLATESPENRAFRRLSLGQTVDSRSEFEAALCRWEESVSVQLIS